MTPRALMQAIPDRYVDATRGVLASDVEPIDLRRARAQHAGIVAAMEWLGWDVTVLDPDGAGPDAVFVEDPVVVVGERAWMARSAHPGRAREGDRLAPVLSGWGLRCVPQRAGTLDGGDVLIVGPRAFIGRSARTDDGGIRSFAEQFPELDVVPVDLPGGTLHLKCDASPLGDGRVLATAAMAARLGLPHVEVPAPEAYAANAVGRDGRVVVAEGFPRTAEALLDAGYEVRAVPSGEIRKGDGSLTCLSIRL